MHLVCYKRFQFCYFLNTEKCIPPIQNIECLMKSERSFVTVQRIDGVEIPPWPSPCTHKEQSQMTEHQASFQKMSFLILYCIAGLLSDILHNCMSRFNYFMSSLIKSKLSSNTTQLCLWFSLIQAFLSAFLLLFSISVSTIIALETYTNNVKVKPYKYKSSFPITYCQLRMHIIKTGSEEGFFLHIIIFM